MALNKLTLVFLSILFSVFSSFAQTDIYLVRFTDKNSSPYSISQPDQFLSTRALDRRARVHAQITADDLPVNDSYLNALRGTGAVVRYSLKWMNAAVVEADPTMMGQINLLSFVSTSGKVKRYVAEEDPKSPTMAQKSSYSEAASSEYGFAYAQTKMLGIELLHEEGLHGEGMLIAVFDAGFISYDAVPAFSSLIARNGVLLTIDIVGGDQTVNDTGNHGLAVLSIMAAYDPGKMMGPAYKANFMLFRTEDESSESPLEELNWARAAEMADSAGADIIHSSLGYSTFDNPLYDYSYTDLDGNTAWVTQAADKAGYRGVLVVNSAGNEGTNSWHYITPPADGDSVMAVGAASVEYIPATFSSYGPTADGRNKPDVSAHGYGSAVAISSGGYTFGSGTSYAAPMISGFAACVWQAHPEWTNMQLMQWIRVAGHLYPAYHEQLGYGIPDYHRLRFEVENGFETPAILLAPNPVKQGDWVQVYLSQPLRDHLMQIRVYDVMGREMENYQFTPDQVRESIMLCTDNLPNGMYVVELTTSTAVTKLKFQVY